MRSRQLIWIVFYLLLAAGAWLFWAEIHPQKIVARKIVRHFVATSSTSPKVLPASMAATNAVQTVAALAKTNRFPWRLANTKKTIGELTGDPHAILLENAFIDTREPLNLAIPKDLKSKGDPGAYIVQANGPIGASFRAALAAAGAQIVSYIPNNAYLVSAQPDAAKKLASEGFSVVPYEPYYKMSPSFLTAMEKNPGQPLAVTELRVAAYPGDAAEAETALKNLGAKIIGREQSPLGEVFTVQNVSDTAALAQVGVFQLVEPFHTRVLANDLARVTLGISTNTITGTNYMGLTGKNVMVEVNDTGIDAKHPDFAANQVVGDAIQSLVDTNGHGTHVAGIIAGDGAKSSTINTPPNLPRGSVTNADFRGKAQAATLYSIGALGDDTNIISDRYLQESAAKTNALISNNSWILGGDNAYDLTAASYDAAVRDALPGVTGSQPVLFVFAAGDDGSGNDSGGGGDPDTVDSPATAKNVISVGALEQLRNITNIVTDANSNSSAVWQPMTDSSDQVAGYSSRGNVGVGTEGTFGRFKPDVVAPGTFVVSLRSGQWDKNAYYNPTNYSYESASDVVTTNSPNAYSVSVPANAVEVDISVTANTNSPSPFPDFPIYVALTGTPGPGNNDFSTDNNQVKIPGDSPAGYLQSIQNGGFNFAVADGTNVPANYDVTVEIITTNDLGNYLTVLSNLNETLAPYYRYESGTSMSAPAISGVLALMQDYFTNTLALTPSPALLKAMLINGSRAVNNYRFAVTNTINFQGWGLANLTNSLPPGITNAFDQPCSSFFLDQSPVNALATGDSHTFTVTITNLIATLNPLRVTLAWTDPPGDPAAAIKLVNNLDLIVSNSVTGKIYYGNNFSSSGNPPFSVASNPTNAPVLDSINNVENVFVPPLLSQGTYYVTVVGRGVNVNAVTAQTNNTVQDFALVISCGEGEETNAMTVSDNPIVSNPTGDQNITYVTATNTPLLNQFVGANTPLLGTNAIQYGATNEQITLGMTNQWHFYIVTNTTTFTNAAFITFLPDTAAIPRMGVFADSQADSTRPEADIDLYVARSSVIANAGALTNLDPTVISNADKSLTRGGTEFVAYTNAQPNEVFYVGVKSEDHEGAEYGFIPIFTQTPFSQIGPNGDEYINGLNVPVPIPDGSPSHPGTVYVFAIAMSPIEIQRVVVTNYVQHQNFGDLIGTLSHNGINDVLNNHDGLGNWPGTPLIYDDSGQGDIPNSQPSDGPGSLQSYVGDDGSGVWRLTEIDDALTQTGSVAGLSLFVEKHQNPQKGINVIVQPGTWYYTYIDVPAGITNLQIFATNLTASAALQLYLRYASQPDKNNYDLESDLTNGVPPGTMISDGPPLIAPGRYFIGIFNPSLSAENVFLLAALHGPTLVVEPTDITTNGPPLLDDAVTNSTIFISDTHPIASMNVGIVVQHPRISDLTFTLISPSGQRILLMENRGGLTATNAGNVFYVTNSIGNFNTNGTVAAQTNFINVGEDAGSLSITYDMFTIPDEMTIYYGTNSANFYTGSPDFLYDSGMASGTNTITVNFGPGASTYVTIIMNQSGNTNGVNDAWNYMINGIEPNYNYLTFTENTNLTTIPIKFAVPPFDLRDMGTNFNLSDFELATNGDYFAPTNIYDAFGGWYLPTNIITLSTVITNIGTNGVILTMTNVTILTNNEVSVVTDPGDSFAGGATNFSGTNFLALANGYILRTNFMTPQRKYVLTYLYRGPGISGWWRGEGEALDYADPERLGQNGSLIGRFDFPAGEVGQAFQMENNGSAYDFAGTNSYVQIRQQPFTIFTGSDTNLAAGQASHLDVGTGTGFTIEGWINPTNVSFQQPLVEWLARVPTNGSDTNLNIVAGPFLDRETGHYYYLLDKTNWTTSELWATQLGGHLATVDTANEQNWIFDSFASYGGTNRNLWIGLTNSLGTTFGYSSGLTNITYFNWLTGQPTNCDDTRNFTMMFGATNAEPGLWALADNNGFTCDNPTKTNQIYGVVEVNDIQTNGVQFWISVTNIPGTTNTIVSSNGCLYADLVDTTNGDHIIFSAPDLVQSNVFQHVALTYDTNSGIANLFYNGTNVATTNFGVAFIPKTTGDVLLGKDMSRETNNFYGGKMDEMSIYSRALSDAEIAAIYKISASTTNRLVGKFDPSVTPPESLAEAQVVLGAMTNTIFGENDTWQIGGFTFTAQSNSLPMQITGIEPGMLFDSFSVGEIPIGNLYYFPEQSLDELTGESAHGNWTLEIWDNRTGAAATNAQLVSWQLQMVLKTNTPPPVAITPEAGTTLTVPPGQTITLTIDAPSWARFATNILVSASSPLNMFFNQTNLTGSSPPDYPLLNNSTSGRYPLVATNTLGVPVTTPPLVPGQTYYLGLQNPGTHSATAVVEVDFDITALTNSVPVTDTLQTNDSGRYFSFDVSSNAFEATFQLLKLSGNADLVVRKGAPLPTLLSSDYGSFNVGNADENIYVLTNSSPVPLSAGTWFVGVIKRDSGVVKYTVLAKELTNNVSPQVTFIQLTNGMPFNYTTGPGADLTNFFRFTVTNTITPTVTNYVSSIHFELYHLTGNGDLTVQTNAPPFAPPFFQSSQQPGTIPEFIQIHTNSALTNLAATWFLGVPNHEITNIGYTIIAIIDTNNVFPAFPGAEGAGAGALGGGSLPARGGFTNNTVYHVINLNDSGPGSLRDAVSSTNRTIVFDVSGILFLQSPLIITNSYLTIAGQTAPGGGITVAGQMTELQSVHDVVIRDVRFRFGGAIGTGAWSTGFEEASAADYTASHSVSGFTVLTNQVSVVTDQPNANQGNNFLALASGIISNSLPTVAGQTYTLSFAYRGPGIVSLWSGENGNTDSVSGNNGTPIGTVTYTNAIVGKGFRFNGNSYIDVPHNTSLNLVNSFTLEMWYEDLNTTFSGFGLIAKRGTGVGPCNFGINILDNGTGVYYNDPNYNGDPSSDDQLTYETSRYPINPVANVFHHIVAGYKQADPTHVQLQTYVDGQLIRSKLVVGNLTNTLNTDVVTIGASSPNGEFMNGIMDEVSIYKRLLSDSEIQAIYLLGEAGKSKFDSTAPSVSQGLAEAAINLQGTNSAQIFGNNTNWQTYTATFTATQSGTPLTIAGIEPGVLLDSFTLTGAATNTVAATNADSLQFDTVSNVIADHISALWSSNEDLSVLNSTNVTVQWSIISDSLNATNVLHGYGSLLRHGSGTLSFHHNLYADNAYANPRLGDNISLDFVNNVIYDWGTNAGFSTNDIADNPLGFTNQLNYICNYLIASTNSLTNYIAFWGGTTNTWIYQTNNFIDSNTNGILDGANTGWDMFTNRFKSFTPFDRQFPLPPVSVDEAFLAYEKVLDFAGPDMDKRDWADTNIISKVRSQTGQIISIRPTIGLVAWWKGESNALDSVGTNNGMLMNGAGFAPGEVGQAFNLNGINQYVLVQTVNSNLDVGQDGGFTIEGWINPTNSVGQLPFVEYERILGSGNNNDVGVHFYVSLSSNPGGLYANIKDTSGIDHTMTAPASLVKTSVWQHVALTYNKATGIGIIYLNGTNVLQQNVGSFTPQTSFTNVLIGARTAFGSVASPSDRFSGGLDEISIYNRALSQAEIQSIYKIGRAGKFYTDVMPYLDTDQDGIPDFWEMTFTPGYIFVPSDKNDRDGDGYTDLEEYNNWLAGPHALTITNTPVGVDLQQLFGQTGNLSFFLTNAVNGSVYLTNVLNSVTNIGTYSNTIAWFTPTNNFGGIINSNYGSASFDVYVTNNDTIAYFGPVTVSVVVSKVTVRTNYNMPPVIITLTSGVLDPTNISGSQFYDIPVPTGAAGMLVYVTNIVGGPLDLAVSHNNPNPSLSDYDYISTNSAGGYESIAVWTTSTPVPLTNGDWYAGVINVSPSGAPITYDIGYTIYGAPPQPPVFLYPTNTTVTNIVETFPFSVACVAKDLNSPPAPLTFALVNLPANIAGATNVMTIDPNTGVINWTPNEAQGPSTNSISVSVSNGGSSVTNTFTIIVEESNLPPVPPSIPDQVVIVPNTLVVTNTATDPDIPANPLTYSLLVAPAGADIDTNGIITWTPTLAQAGSNYLFTTIVTDTNPPAINSKSLSATNSFYVTVATSATGGSPQTNTVPPGDIDWVAVSVPTNAVAATNILLYATNLPVNVWFSTNATIANAIILMSNATSGISVLTTNSAPTNIVAGSIYFLGVQNTNSVAVTYGIEVNFQLIGSTNAVTNSISISSIVYTNVAGTNGYLLTWFAPSNDLFKVQWTASLAPANWSTFTNIISYNTNAFTNPTNAQFNFFDDGSQTVGFGGTRFYRLILLSSANMLTLPNQTNYIANVGMPLAVTNTATDSSVGAILTYKLTNFPTPSTNPVINNTNGIITWTPGTGDSGSAFKFTTVVTDNGIPPLSATNAFTVFVLPPPAISNVVATATNVILQWSAPTNDIFHVEWTTNLTPLVIWTPFPPIITSTDGLFDFMDTNAPLATKFYRLLWLPLP